MNTSFTTKELRSMQASDLHREVAALQTMIANMRLGIQLRKEKDTAAYRRARRALARVMTVLGEALLKPKKPTTLERR